MDPRAYYANGPTNTLTTHRLDCRVLQRINHSDATDNGGWDFKYVNGLVIVVPMKPGMKRRDCKICKP